MRQMKRPCIFCLAALIFCLMFASCKSKEAINVDELIMSIGTVTLDSEPAIETAEIHYQALTEKQKEEVENNVVLVQARHDYDKLRVEEDARLQAEEEARLRAEEEARLQAEAEEAARKAEEARERIKALCSDLEALLPTIDQFSADILAAWRFAINNAYDLSRDVTGASIAKFATEMGLDENTVRESIAFSLLFSGGTHLQSVRSMWFDPSPDVKSMIDEFIDPTISNGYFAYMGQSSDGVASAAILLVESLHVMTQTDVEITNELYSIKNELRQITKKYSTITNLEAIQGCISEVDNYYDYLQNFEGSHQTVSQTISDYQKEIQLYFDDIKYSLLA